VGPFRGHRYFLAFPALAGDGVLEVVLLGLDDVLDVEELVLDEGGDDVVEELDDELDDDSVLLDDFLLPYRSAPQPPPLSTNEVRLTRRTIFPFAPHFSHLAGAGSPIFCSRSTSLPHF
jgi:hypothetical protein